MSYAEVPEATYTTICKTYDFSVLADLRLFTAYNTTFCEGLGMTDTEITTFYSNVNDPQKQFGSYMADAITAIGDHYEEKKVP